MESLPSELQLYLLSFITEEQDLLSCSRVSRLFREYIMKETRVIAVPTSRMLLSTTLRIFPRLVVVNGTILVSRNESEGHYVSGDLERELEYISSRLEGSLSIRFRPSDYWDRISYRRCFLNQIEGSVSSLIDFLRKRIMKFPSSEIAIDDKLSWEDGICSLALSFDTYRPKRDGSRINSYYDEYGRWIMKEIKNLLRDAPIKELVYKELDSNDGSPLEYLLSIVKKFPHVSFVYIPDHEDY